MVHKESIVRAKRWTGQTRSRALLSPGEKHHKRQRAAQQPVCLSIGEGNRNAGTAEMKKHAAALNPAETGADSCSSLSHTLQPLQRGGDSPDHLLLSRSTSSRRAGTDGCPQTPMAHQQSQQAPQHTPEGCSWGRRASLQARTLTCIYYKNQDKAQDFASHLRKHPVCSGHSVTHIQVPVGEQTQTLVSETGPFPGTKGVGMLSAAAFSNARSWLRLQILPAKAV